MTVDVRVHGARGDSREVTDAVVWSGSNHLWSLSAAFSADDVGRTVEVMGAGPPGAIHTTIAAVLDPTRVRMQFPPMITASGQALVWRRGLLADVVLQDGLLFLRATVPAWTTGDARRTLDLHLPHGVLRATIADVVTPWFVRLVEVLDLPSRLAVSWDKVVFDAEFRAGQPEVTSASAGFHPEVDRFGAAIHGARPAPLVARIEAAAQKFARLSVPAAHSVTGAACFIGSNDSAAFRAALDKDRAVMVPPGTYLLDGDLTLPEGAQLVGRSPLVRPRLRRIGGRVLFDLRGAHNVSLERLQLDGGYVLSAQSTVIDGREHPETQRPTRGLSISHCRFTHDGVQALPSDPRCTAVGQGPNLCALQLRHAEEVTLADNEIQGLQLDLTSGGGARSVTVVRNVLRDCIATPILAQVSGALPLEDLVIADNEIRGDLTVGLAVGGVPDLVPPRFAAVRRVSVRGNRIDGASQGMVGVGFGSSEDWVIEGNTVTASRGTVGISLLSSPQSPFVNLTVRGNRLAGRFERAALELRGERYEGVWITRNEVALTGPFAVRVGQDGAMMGYSGVVIADNVIRSAPPGIAVGSGSLSGAIREQSNKLEGPPS
jgi:hypothetical protein